MPPAKRYLWIRKAAARVSPAVSAAIDWIGRAEPLYGLAGPVFEKELRVSARRRRYYVLRVVYLAGLGGFVGLLWLSLLTMPHLFGGRTAYSYWTAYAGGIITATVIWAEFLALPLLAMVMLSTSIGDEVYHRTLGVLMTTPINSLHIVLGKFLGKMIQLALLMAISLPILLVVRVLGGTPLEYVLAGTGITLTATALLGALSMLFSISSRVVPVVILKTVLAGLLLYVLAPIVWVTGLKQAQAGPDERRYYINPCLALGAETAQCFSPAAPAAPVMYWWLHCLVMLGLTVPVLAVCMVRVRRAALRQLTGEVGWWRRGRRSEGKVRRIRGSPIVWKEARSRIFKRRLGSLLGLAGILALLGVTYWLTGQEILTSANPHITYGIVLFLLGGLATAVIAAIGVPAEKESGAWALLLATPLEEREIILGKAVGGLRRSLPAWMPLFFHLGLFTALGTIHPIVLPLVAMVVLGNACLLTGSGLFWGVLLKRTATAAIANLLVLIGVWFALPMVLSFAFMMIGTILAAAKVMGYVVFERMVSLFMLHPFMEIGVIVDSAAGDKANLALDRMSFPLAGSAMGVGIVPLILIVMLVMAGYAAVGGFLARAATGLVRRGAF